MSVTLSAILGACDRAAGIPRPAVDAYICLPGVYRQLQGRCQPGILQQAQLHYLSGMPVYCADTLPEAQLLLERLVSHGTRAQLLTGDLDTSNG